jgi:hypothetical protein
MRQKTSIGNITLGALIVASFITLNLIAPIDVISVRGIMSIITLIPMALYTLKCGNYYGIIVVVVSILTSIFFAPITSVVIFFIPSAISGFVAGSIIRNKHPSTCIIIICLLFLLLKIYKVLLYFYIMKVDLIKQYIELVSMAIDIIKKAEVNSNIIMLTSHMLLFSIVIVAIVSELLKSILVIYIINSISRRLFNIYMPTNKTLQINPKFKAWIGVIYITSLILDIIILQLLQFSILKYLIIYSIFIDLSIAFGAIYYLTNFETLKTKYQSKKYVFYLILSVTSILFIFTNIVFVILDIKKLSNYKNM